MTGAPNKVGLWDRIVKSFADSHQISDVTQISEILGLSYQSVHKWKSGLLPSIDTLLRISDLTNSSIHWLLTGEGPKNFKGLKEQLAASEPYFKGLKEQLAAKPQEPFQNLLKQDQAEPFTSADFGFSLAEIEVIQKIADGSGMSFEEAVGQLVREALFAKGVGKMPDQVAVPEFNMIDADIDTRIFSYLEHLPQPTQQAETQRLIGALVTRAAGA